MMDKVSERFSTFQNENYFSRVDNSHPLELFIGLDDKGRYAIELRARFTPRRVSGTAAIEVSQFKRADYNTIRFSLCDQEMSGLFYTFCEDLIDQTRSVCEKAEGYQAIVARFYLWKKLFVTTKGGLLSEPEIMGLIGEILFMRGSLADRLGQHCALTSWSGQELTHKDFSFGDSWAEVKAVSRGSQNVRISSLEQLASENVGELAVFSLEKMSPTYSGITLNALVVDTRALFSDPDDKDLFMTKVSLQGYSYNNYYDEFVYEIVDFSRYKVDEDFPRLTRENVNPAVSRVSYELSLAKIIKNKME